MAGMTIRHLDEQLKTRLRHRAALHGRSMEEEARDILRSALSSESAQSGNLAERISRRLMPLGGVELADLTRDPIRREPDFGQ